MPDRPAPVLIDGVFVKPLKNVKNERGGLLEIQRHDDKIFPGFGQAYTTTTLPGVIKAWYRHHHQTDQHAVLKGAMKLVLYDDRPSSATRGVVSELILHENEPALVQFPPGIWHGFRSTGPEALLLLHLNSKAFIENAPDEERIPQDDPRVPYRW
jgi:dTDP-4-dehydrorhamnose 3,5-epimerase